LARAYRWIAQKPHSVWEVRQKLKRYASEHEIDEVISRLLRYKLLDDINFSAGFASYRMRERNLGPARIRIELSARGIASEVIDQALETAFLEISEEDAASVAARKFLSKHALKTGPRDYRRIYGHLHRSGFTPEIIRRILCQIGFESIDWSME
jgi:regulatory protein